MGLLEDSVWYSCEQQGKHALHGLRYFSNQCWSLPSAFPGVIPPCPATSRLVLLIKLISFKSDTWKMYKYTWTICYELCINTLCQASDCLKASIDMRSNHWITFEGKKLSGNQVTDWSDPTHALFTVQSLISPIFVYHCEGWHLWELKYVSQVMVDVQNLHTPFNTRTRLPHHNSKPCRRPCLDSIPYRHCCPAVCCSCGGHWSNYWYAYSRRWIVPTLWVLTSCL